MPSTIKRFDTIKRMRKLTELGIPFEFEFLSYNQTTGVSVGFKKVFKAQLRKGYRDEQSDKSNVLIGYVNEFGKNRWFYLPLLIRFNGHIIQP